MDRREIRQRAVASYLGLAIGDALGATTEFMTAREIQATHGVHRNIVGGGWLKLKPGRVTDDTEMALALGEAIIVSRGLDAKVVAEKFVEWMRKKPVDIGGTVRRGLQRYIVQGTLEAEYSDYGAGNGAAMRNLPVILATLENDDAFREWTVLQGRVTHNNAESDNGMLMLGELTRMAIMKGQAAPLQSIASTWIEKFKRFDYKKFRPNETDAYIVNTVRVALHFFFNTFDFESCLIGVVNQGGDADTNAALAGQLAGAFYGMDSIPARWLKKLDPAVKEKVEQQAEKLLDMFFD